VSVSGVTIGAEARNSAKWK